MDDDGPCVIHGYEPVPDEWHILCIECGHVFVTAEDLLREHNRVMDECGFPRVADVEQVAMCPFCTHDF